MSKQFYLNIIPHLSVIVFIFTDKEFYDGKFIFTVIKKVNLAL